MPVNTVRCLCVSSQRKPSLRIGYAIRWAVMVALKWLLLLTAAAYIAWVFLVSVWWILGAILNPTRFLPFAAAVVAFFAFLVAKATMAWTLRKSGKDIVTKIVTKKLQAIVDSR